MKGVLKRGVKAGVSGVVKRIVATGSECTGKTTLAEALAQHYQVPWVPEFARRFVTEKGAPPVFADVEAIARGQVALEDDVAATTSTLLIQDTDLLSTVVYSHHYYGACPAWVEAALLERCADLYLLAGIDVPWAPDGNQRDRGDRRQQMQDLFRQALLDRGLPFCEIEGSVEARVERAVGVIRDATAMRGW